ncbi:MAG: TIGR04086 family membrane protein [Clostridia bacterium]|nr:TIGR04086 family membrane protein [Clostridia bacterium]
MEKGLFDFKKASKCALLSLVVTVLLGGILAFFVYFLQIEEATAKMIIFAIMIVSVLFGGFVLAKNISGKGLLNGLLMSVIYFAILLLLSFMLNGKMAIKVSDITRLVTLAASGMLGGILGVNT